MEGNFEKLKNNIFISFSNCVKCNRKFGKNRLIVSILLQFLLKKYIPEKRNYRAALTIINTKFVINTIYIYVKYTNVDTFIVMI